ncbi:hypothetical protein FKP32DRAFT_1564644 [Trametes sanguinea]|nr:hypothetical protein FKP32DRAFT_1564644 [Trametes sanguinea]
MHATPLICDWGQCYAQLNSWKTLQEHLHRHCQQLEPASNGGLLECMIHKCSGRFHHNLGDMLQHIDLSHLSRILLPCPAQGCPLTFGRNANGLPDHFRSLHRELLHWKDIKGSSGLRPLRRPHPHVPERLPPLPEEAVPAYMLTTPTIPPARPRGGRAPTASQGGRRRWRKMLERDESLGEEESSTPLADLPRLDPRRVPAQVVRRRPLEPRMQQSRPQNMVVPPVREPDPPMSIGYSAFARRYVELEKAGIIDGTGLWPTEKVKKAHTSEDGVGRLGGDPDSSKQRGAAQI